MDSLAPGRYNPGVVHFRIRHMMSVNRYSFTRNLKVLVCWIDKENPHAQSVISKENPLQITLCPACKQQFPRVIIRSGFLQPDRWFQGNRNALRPAVFRYRNQTNGLKGCFTVPFQQVWRIQRVLDRFSSSQESFVQEALVRDSEGDVPGRSRMDAKAQSLLVKQKIVRSTQEIHRLCFF